MYPEMDNKNQQQMRAYREMADADLFTEQWVEVDLPPKEFPGYKGDRIACAACGEGINYDRYIERDGALLCHACAHPETRYYRPAPIENSLRGGRGRLALCIMGGITGCPILCAHRIHARHRLQRIGWARCEAQTPLLITSSSSLCRVIL